MTLQINNGSAYTETIELGSDEILADELDLTDYFTGTGWKGIKFSSSQLGRVNAQLIVKVDLTA